MAYKIRVATRKEQLKKPDEFIGTIDRLGEKIRERAKLFWILLAVVLFVGSGIGLFWFLQTQQKNRAAGLEYQALQYYHQQVAPDDQKAAPSKEDNEKKAIEQFQKILEEYPRTPSAAVARYYIGNAYMELKDYDSAISAYRSFLEGNPANDVMVGMIYQRLGYAYLEKGNPEEARQSFEKVDGLAGSINKDQAMYELGRIDETLDIKEDAIKQYQELISRYPDSMFLSEAQRRLTALGVKTESKTNPPVQVSPTGQPLTVAPSAKQKPVGGSVPMPMEKK